MAVRLLHHDHTITAPSLHHHCTITVPGGLHTLVWTDTGELFTCGYGTSGALGHAGNDAELVPRLVEALAGEKVVGGAADFRHSVVFTEVGELFTFGGGGRVRAARAWMGTT